jgi:hypothetical protein
MKRNYPAFNDYSIITLGKLTYDDAIALGQWIEDQTRSFAYGDKPAGKLRAQHDAELKIKWERDAEENDRRKKRQAELDKLITLWIMGGHLTAGMVVKMKGCRDRKGLRQVLSVKNGNVECRQIFPAVRRAVRHKVGCYEIIRPESLGQITTHFSNKIQAVKIGDKFVPIRKIVEANQEYLRQKEQVRKDKIALLGYED